MTITLNGILHTVPDPCTLAELLASLGLTDRPVVVEYNTRALPPHACHTVSLANGDTLEIISIVAGG